MSDSRKIIHVDMDAFYASVEQRDDPRLRGRAVVVGGSPEGRGVVAAASYEARRFGIRSAMPCSQALRRCPELVFVRPDFTKYRTVSQQIRAIFHDYTDLVEPLSLDEAYLDVTSNKAGLASATEVARVIRERVREELQLTCSAGVSSLKFVAKIASDYRKPDGLTVVPPHRVLEFIRPLPVRKLWGVGPATERRLHAQGIQLVGDLADIPEPDARRRFGRNGLYLWRMARGDDPRPVCTSRPRRSSSTEQTFSEDITSLEELQQILEDQAERVARQVERADLWGRTVTLKLRYADFSTITRSETLTHPTRDRETIEETGLRLLGKTDAGERPVRLIGLGLGNLLRPEESPQLDLPFL